MAQAIIVITHSESDTDIKRLLPSSNTMSTSDMSSSNKIIDYLTAAAGGVRKASIEVDTAAAQASGTITFTGTGAANDTILINGVTFTAKASGASGNEWNVGASATLSAAALAAAINASATALVSGLVSAAAVSGVVTISALRYGVDGNAMTIAEGVDSGNAMAVSGARLTGGSKGTVTTLKFGGA